MPDAAVDAFFLGSGSDRRFAVLTTPRDGQVRGGILFVPAFAEEMNKSRRMVSLAARALAQDGFATLQIDLHGCGDSAGDLADASWSGWTADIVGAHEWLRQHTGLPTSVCAIRAGALLAAAAVPALPSIPDLIFWQPTLSGSQLLKQFIRLRTVGSVIAGESGAGMSKALLARLMAGHPVEVAGYMIPPAIAKPMEQARLDLVPPCPSVLWLEVSASAPATLSPAAIERANTWIRSGITVASAAVMGPQFWQTQEIEECPALIEATRAALRRTQT